MLESDALELMGNWAEGTGSANRAESETSSLASSKQERVPLDQGMTSEGDLELQRECRGCSDELMMQHEK